MSVKKKASSAYLLLIVGSALGLHLFYLERHKRALFNLFSFITFFLLTIILSIFSSSDNKSIALIFGLQFFAYILIWLFLFVNDVVKIPNWTREANGEPIIIKEHRIIMVPKEVIQSPDHPETHPQEVSAEESPKSALSKKTIKHLQRIGEYVVIDIETTGLDRDDDRITEIAAVKYKETEEIGRLFSLIRPYTFKLETLDMVSPQRFEDLKGDPSIKYVSKEITKMTGITNDMLINAPSEKEVLEEFNNFVGHSPVVGHNIGRFDIPFINNALKRHSIKSSFGYIQYDTFWMAKRLLSNMHNLKLITVGKRLGIEGGGSHRALEDVLFNTEVFHKLIGRVPAKEDVMDQGKTYDWNLNAESFKPNPDADQTNPFYGKQMFITGNFGLPSNLPLYKEAANVGAELKKTVTLKFNGFVVYGEFDEYEETTSFKKARQYSSEGRCTIEFLTGVEFLEMIGKSQQEFSQYAEPPGFD